MWCALNEIFEYKKRMFHQMDEKIEDFIIFLQISMLFLTFTCKYLTHRLLTCSVSSSISLPCSLRCIITTYCIHAIVN